MTTEKRDLRLDTMRGILLVMMTLNHLNGELKVVTSQPFGFVTAAEGFILLSAYTYAITSRIVQASFASLVQTAGRRSLRIYKYHVLAFLFLLFLGLVVPTYGGYFGPSFFINDDPARVFGTVIGVLTLTHQPVLFDILPMYIVFSLLSPIVLYALRKQQGGLVFTASLSLWIIGNLFDPIGAAVSKFGIDGNTGYFDLFSWQLLWVFGLYIGFAHNNNNWRAIPCIPHMIAIATIVFALCLLFRHSFMILPSELQPYFSKRNLGVLRVANVAAQLVLLLSLFSLIHRTASVTWLRFIGTYSLQVFSYHLVIVYILRPVSPSVTDAFGIEGNIIYSLIVVATLSLPALIYRRMKLSKIATEPQGA